jgi:pimeloyl-ACP methyl ester carboxylesterase
MQVLRWRLQRAGFATFNWGYRSWWGDVETHAEAFAVWLSKLEQSGEFARIHIVAHSLGSIVTRCMLVKHQFPLLGRIVMLCPPNRGSHMATLAAGLLPPLKTLQQIADGEASWVNQLPQTMPVETGVVVAQGDRVVRPAATQINGVTEYVEVPGMHTAVLFRRRVAELCVEFLRTGHFTQGH